MSDARADEIMHYRVVDLIEGKTVGYAATEEQAKALVGGKVPEADRYEKLTMPEPLWCLLQRASREKDAAELPEPVSQDLPRPTERLRVRVAFPAGYTIVICSLDSGDTLHEYEVPYAPDRYTGAPRP